MIKNVFASSALSKRASYPNQAIVIVIRFFIIYYPTCFYHCQLDKSPILRSILQSMSLSTFDFYGLRIYKYGSFYQTAQRIKCVQIMYVSLIRKMISSIEYSFNQMDFLFVYFSSCRFDINKLQDSRSNRGESNQIRRR